MNSRPTRINRVQAAGLNIGTTILEFITTIPNTDERASAMPAGRAELIAQRAARRAATMAGALALPPGPWGWLTILPELIGVWRVQAQMVADIAAIHGKGATLTSEHMAYCLFRHVAAQALRDVVVRVGERFLVRRASLRLLQSIASQVGVDISRRALSRAVSRWVPLVGAAGVAAYAYYDTREVAKTAIEFFGQQIDEADPVRLARSRRGSLKATGRRDPRRRRTATAKTEST